MYSVLLLTPITSSPVDDSVAGKNVASINILHNCVNKYVPPACTHFQNAPYSALKNKHKSKTVNKQSLFFKRNTDILTC